MLFLIVSDLLSLWLSFGSSNYYWIEKVRHSYVRLFDLGGEANIPTWFSSSILLMSALLLAKIYRLKRAVDDEYARHWGVLAVIFTGFSLDETAVIHEMAIVPLRAMFHLKGLLYYGWILIGIISVLIVAIAYFKFLFALPETIRHLFVWAASLFVGGGIVVESLTGFLMGHDGQRTLVCALFETIEESMEMSGVIVFIYALLSYIELQSTKIDQNPVGTIKEV